MKILEKGTPETPENNTKISIIKPDTLINDIINDLFQKEKDSVVENRVLEDIWALFEKDYLGYQPIETRLVFDESYSMFESSSNEDKNLYLLYT